MKILVLGGSGSMGSVAVRDLAESSEVSEVVIGDRDIKKTQELCARIKSEKVSVRGIDVLDHDNLVESMRGLDVVANATWYEYNLDVTKAAIEARINYTDLGGLYYMTLKQLELNDSAKDVGVTAILGCGLAPGLTNVLARHGANKLDRVKEIHIRAGGWEEPYPTPTLGLKFAYSIRTYIEQYTRGAIIYQNGEYKEASPLSGKEMVKFPDYIPKVGEVENYYSLHSELATLPRFMKGVREVDLKLPIKPELIRAFKALTDLGLQSAEPIKVKNIRVSPKEFLIAYLSVLSKPPETKSARAWKVEVIGGKNGEKTRCTLYTICEPYERWNVKSGMAYGTGVALSIASQMLARGDIKDKGVMPPEVCIPPESFIAQLNEKGIPVYESTERTREL